MKMTSQRAENLVHVKQHHSKSFYKKNIFSILLFIADMADQMCNFYNFDIDQMSPKFAQRYYFVYDFCYKKISIVGSLDYAENCLKTLFLWIPNITCANFYSSFFIVFSVKSRSKDH